MSEKILILLCCTIVLVSAKYQYHPPPDCKSLIYCHGPLLFDVQTQLVREFLDSSYFVNMKLKRAPKIILAEFEDLDYTGGNHQDHLRKFVNKHFELYTAEEVSLSDHQEIPHLDEFVLNQDYRDFASSISKMWTKLSAKTSEDVDINKHLHSLIYLPNPYIKRDEFSSTMDYWETYYAFRGLLVNGMYDSALRIILNFAYLIDKYGFVLQSNRVYFSRRTQTPMLGLMVESYLAIVGDEERFIETILPLLEVEFHWWLRHRLESVHLKGEQYFLFRHNYKSEEPRPEEFKIDYSLASKFEAELDQDFTVAKSHGIVQKQHFYFSAVHSLSESGFGFTSRFNRKNLRNKSSSSRLNTDVKNFIPVELNCILQRYANLLMAMNKNLGHTKKEIYYQRVFAILSNSFDKVLWNEENKMWFDWDTIKKEHNKRFSPTNLMPLFTKSYDLKFKSEFGEYAVNYLVKEGIIYSKYPHKPKYFIIPTSNDLTGEKWDYPFGSPLLNAFVIEGLHSTGQSGAQQVALELAQRLVKTCYEGYTAHKTLFKEYDCTRSGSDRKKSGQKNAKFSESGYAPTNGALLVLLKLYGRSLTSADDPDFIPMPNIIPLL